MTRLTFAGMTLAAFGGLTSAAAKEPATAEKPPQVGSVFKNFKLPGMGRDPVELGKLVKQGPVVVIVLRGFPGYQCPLCSRQLASFVEHAKEFERRKATVVLIYPGPEGELKKRAREFLGDGKLPAPFVMAIDPGYKFTTRYNLRWDAPGETAYPSTFVLDGDRKVKFRKVSHAHGNRAEADEVLAALRAK